MSPFFKKIMVGTGAAALLGTLWNCSLEGNGDVSSIDDHSSKVSVLLKHAETPILDSIVLDCQGMDTLHIVKQSLNDGPFEMDLFPYDNWKFTAKLYAGGTLMQVGELTTALEAGTKTSLHIQMHPIVGFIYIEVPLGLGNPLGIISGKMILEKDDEKSIIPMELNGSVGTFLSKELQLGSTYAITLTLDDRNGLSIFSIQDSLYIDENSPVPDFKINSLRSKVDISLSTSEPVEKDFTLRLPGYNRKPYSGDLIITEFFASPLKTDSNQYEFVEIFNGTLDTLNLEECTLGQNSQPEKGKAFKVKKILPNQIIVLGDTSANTPKDYQNTDGWIDLTNTKSTIVIQCGGYVVDSLYYSNVKDSTLNAIPNYSNPSKAATSSHLNMEHWENRSDSSSWCLSTATPGVLSYCL